MNLQCCQCDATILFADSYRGKTVTCPSCRNFITVPERDPTPEKPPHAAYGAIRCQRDSLETKLEPE